MNASYHIVVMRITDGALSFHSGGKQVSDRETSLSQFEVLGGSSNLYVILHASFMIAAWVGAASSGIVLARYFKQTWKNYKACNIDQWFHVS